LIIRWHLFCFLQTLHAQTLSKLNELAAFNPHQISVLTARLREERDESRRAIAFMQVERQALEDSSRDIISKLRLEQHEALRETTAERNTLVVTILSLQQALKAWKHMAPLAKIAETSAVHGSPKAEEAASFNADNHTTSNISLASHPRGDLVFDFDQKTESGLLQDHGNEVVEPQAYEVALDQISSLSKQVDELKEQLLQTYVAHQEQEKLALLDIEKLRAELIASKELHSQVEQEQTRMISSLELQYSGIQHQFSSLEVSYSSLRKQNEDLTREMDQETGKSKQLLEATRETMQAVIDHLRSQIESMNVEIGTYKQQIVELQEQHSLANEDSTANSEKHTSLQAITDGLRSQIESMNDEIRTHKQQIDELQDQHSVANEDLATNSEKQTSLQATADGLRSQIESMNDEIQAYKQQIADLQDQHLLAHEDLAVASEKQTSQLTTQVEQLTHDLKQQKILTEALEEQLGAAISTQKEHLATVKELEETLQIQKVDSQTELENKEAELASQRDNLEKQLSELQESLEQKSALNLQLQDSVSALTIRIQEEQDAHRTIQEDSEAKLLEALEHRAVVDEKHQVLQSQVEELLEKTKTLEAENGALSDKLEVASEEHQAIRDNSAADLSRTQEELAQATSAKELMSQQLDQVNENVRLLTEQLEQLKSEQSLSKQSSEKYETLLSEFKALEEQLPALS
jgi:chromosome segregation ATPase